MAVNNLLPADMAQSDKIFAITYQFDTPRRHVQEQNCAELTDVVILGSDPDSATRR